MEKKVPVKTLEARDWESVVDLELESEQQARGGRKRKGLTCGKIGNLFGSEENGRRRLNLSWLDKSTGG